ncbi:MAG: GNAT family N-acetyltransferase [Bacteroidales bacterium]
MINDYKIITEYNKINRDKWKYLLNKSPFSSPFQTPEYFVFFNSVSGLSAEVFIVEENDELLTLCLVTFQKEKGIKGYFSRRAIIYGGPLVDNSEKGKLALKTLFSAINKELKHRVIYAETRNFNDYSSYKDCFLKNGWNYIPYLNIQISLQGKTMDDILGAMKYNRRREIQMSIKEGTIAKEAENTEDVTALYNILSQLYKNRVKLPLPEMDFFIRLFNSAVGKVFIVKHNVRIIGGTFCLYYPNKSIYTMYYCGLRDYHPKIFPTHLAIIAAIEFGVNNNLQKVDLMGAGKPDKEYGVRKYKSEFGGELLEHGRFIKVYNPFLFKLGKMGLSIIKKLNY